ncbi:MAG: helix-turn-helix domain-containing protein [Candidatus Altiarchaeales archaeon]|nr:helix-turn-helix domain-containing protein [Candidatus Altiarchaeales archaeon]
MSALREARKRVGLTQVQLAQQSNVSQACVSQLESSGRGATEETWHRLAGVLGCSYEDIAGEPPVKTRLIRNLSGLSVSQLEALNAVAVQMQRRGEDNC